MTDSDSDDTLDLTSNQFNPYKALYSKNVPLPNPSAPVLDNLTKFELTSEGVTVKTTTKRKVEKVSRFS